MNKIVLAGGGTAGHVNPALALIPELRKNFDKIIFIGSKNGIERSLARSVGLDYYYIPTTKLERKLTAKNLLIPFKLAHAISQAKKLLKEIAPSVIFSKGGFVALPTVIAGKQLKIPVVCHESDLSVGLANKICGRKAELFLTSFDCTTLKGAKTIFVGSPINPKFFTCLDKKLLLKKYGFSNKKKILLIFGGSQGSQKLNDVTEKALYKFVNRYNIIHICGKGKGENKREEGYLKIDFTDKIEELFTIADLVVSRAGANSLFELISLNKPTLAIPLSKKSSRGDQIENAEYFKKRNLIEVLSEEILTEDTFVSAVENLEKHADKLTINCKNYDLKFANKKIVELICSVCK